MKGTALCLLVTGFALGGNAHAKLIDGKTEYTPPLAGAAPSNTREYSEAFDTTWRAVVTHLSDTAFVIDNIDKDSGLITVSFSTSEPSGAIQCGSWKSWVKNLRGRRDYAFDGAQAFARYEALIDGKTLATVERRLELTGKFNILVVPAGNGAKVKVTTRYVPTVSLKIDAFILDSNFNRVPPRTFSESTSFNTGDKGKFPGGETVCAATGQLEAAILDGVSAQLVAAPPATSNASAAPDAP